MKPCFTQNQKTILSVDFDRTTTCGRYHQLCEYCYVRNMLRIYPAYQDKTKRNCVEATNNGKNFAKRLNKEYSKLKTSKSKKLKRINTLPVRVYGSGDFIPEHLIFLSRLDFKFYIISKNLIILKNYINKIIKLDNLTSLVLSFDKNNIEKLGEVLKLRDEKIKYCYTGMADEFASERNHEIFDIFFNTSKKRIEQNKSKKIKAACPCDSGKIKLQQSCSYCHKCWK